MMNEQPQDSQPTPATDEDTHGYIVIFRPVIGMHNIRIHPDVDQSTGGARPVGSYPPGVRTDSAR